MFVCLLFRFEENNSIYLKEEEDVTEVRSPVDRLDRLHTSLGPRDGRSYPTSRSFRLPYWERRRARMDTQWTLGASDLYQRRSKTASRSCKT